MGEEPSQTRWTFEDFKMFYNVRFGRKKKTVVEDSKLDNNASYSTGIVNMNGDIKRASDMAVFEQFEQQERQFGIRGAVISGRADGTLLKPLLPPFDSAETRSLAETLCKYFRGLLSPWKGILLFGPPGTGKWPVLIWLSWLALTASPYKYILCLQRLSQLSARRPFSIFQHP